MKIKLCRGIVIDNGKACKEGDKVEVGDKFGASLVANGTAIEVTGNKTKEEFDIDELLDAEDFSKLTVPMLKEVCKYYDLSTDGNKDEIVLRVNDFLAPGTDEV